MSRLEGKIAIVTSAGRIGNIGLADCEAFLREGARAVIGTDLRRDEAESIEARMAGAPGADRFRLLSHDITSEEDWRRVADTVTGEYGGFDVLVNNAGISIHGGIGQRY
jgi:NAD(P)-dependent dehydrogenase (short-subunit alcohol dehydrogenase family)